MINYYEILGLSSGAGSLEIKNAFRRLAKLYHPDKNPNGKEQFNKILKAYEILSDPVQKSSYDYRLKYQAASTQNYDTKSTGTKTWRFDEKELKRRQYYNDYIKKQTEAATNFEAEADGKKSYNEYKYILFATPLAVALFLLIMKLATPYKRMPPNTNNALSPVTEKNMDANQPKTGTHFYNEFFGPPQFDSLQGHSLNLKNKTKTELIVCLFSKGKFLRSGFVKSYDYLDLQNLPAKSVSIKYCSGLKFDARRKIANTNLDGIFTSQLHFYKSLNPVKLKSIGEIFLQADHDGFMEIAREEFFKKE